MTRLGDLLEDLSETDAMAAELRQMAEIDPGDAIAAVNLGAVNRRRQDLERQLGTLLTRRQLDLVRYRVEQFDGSDPPALAVAHSIAAFQTLVTATFDGLRHGPKRLYRPSGENVRLSALTFAHAPVAGEAIHLTVPDDRLLAIESELDAAFALVFDLLAAETKTMVRGIAARAGVAAVAATYAWADTAVQHGLTCTIAWRKRGDERRIITLTHSEALLLRAVIDGVAEEAAEPQLREGELTGIDLDARTFRIVLDDRTTVAGALADGFPRGRWTTGHWYTADLLRAARVRYASGEETVRWTLRSLAPLS